MKGKILSLRGGSCLPGADKRKGRQASRKAATEVANFERGRECAQVPISFSAAPSAGPFVLRVQTSVY